MKPLPAHVIIGTVLLSAIALPAAPAFAAPAAPDVTTGTILGTLTTGEGAPLRAARVYIRGIEPYGYYQTNAGTDGRYRMENLPTGRYQVSFVIPGASVEQGVPGKKRIWEGAEFILAAGQNLTVDDVALPTGTIKGRFADRAGQPLSANISAIDPVNDVHIYGHAGTNGRYTMGVFTGSYQVQFRLGSGALQYAYQQTDQSRATMFAVGAGETVVVNDTRVPTGVIAGRLTEDDGTPVAGAAVWVSSTTGGSSMQAATAADGTYHVDWVPPGTYTVQFSAAGRRQYAYRQVDADKATTVTVEADRTTTVDDSMLPTGSLTVTATTADTGAAVADFCVYLWGSGGDQRGCSNGTGQIELTGIPAGPGFDLTASFAAGEDDRFLSPNISDVTVAAGTTTPLAVVFRLAAIIETTVVDAVTGQPVSDTCLHAVRVPGVGISEVGNGCSDATGQVRIRYLEPGDYRLFALPRDADHGRQWVGATGGTGRVDLAVRITATAGTVTAAPQIRLDAAGTLTGTVTDAVTGGPVAWTCVTTTVVGAAWGHVGYCPGGMTGNDGRYTITGLGPYEWPVEFASGVNFGSDYAWQWHGGVDRRHATPVAVASGQTVTVDAALNRGTTIRGRLVDPAGNLVRGEVVISNAETGDAAGALWSGEDGNYEIRVLPQPVRIGYGPTTCRSEYWYLDAADFDHATIVPVGSETLTIDLVLRNG